MRVVALLLDRGDMNALSSYIEDMDADVLEAWQYDSMEGLIAALRNYDLVMVLGRTSYMICGTWLSDIVSYLLENGLRVMLIRRRING